MVRKLSLLLGAVLVSVLLAACGTSDLPSEGEIETEAVVPNGVYDIQGRTNGGLRTSIYNFRGYRGLRINRAARGSTIEFIGFNVCLAAANPPRDVSPTTAEYRARLKFERCNPNDREQQWNFSRRGGGRISSSQPNLNNGQCLDFFIRNLGAFRGVERAVGMNACSRSTSFSLRRR